MFPFKNHQESNLTDLTPPGETPSSSRGTTLCSNTSSRTLARRTLWTIKAHWLAFSDWLIDWTPCVLVACYWVVCTAIFCMCSSRAIEVFYFFYMIVSSTMDDGFQECVLTVTLDQFVHRFMYSNRELLRTLTCSQCPCNSDQGR